MPFRSDLYGVELPGRTDLEDLAVGRTFEEVVLHRRRLEPGIAFLELEHAFADDLDFAPALQHVVELEIDVVEVPAAANVARYRVSFRNEDGEVIAHVDRRGAGALAQKAEQGEP